MPASDPRAPDFEKLRHLRDQLPAMAKEITKRAQAKSAAFQTVAQRRPRKICKVCMGGYDFVTISGDIKCTAGICPKCDQTLKDGYIALVSAEDYAFIKHPTLADLGGEIIELDTAQFAQWKAKHAAITKPKGN